MVTGPRGRACPCSALYNKRYNSKTANECTRQYTALAGEYGLDPAQMALAFVNQRPFITSTIIGATSKAQLEANIASIELELDKSVLKRIDEIHRSQPNPSP